MAMIKALHDQSPATTSPASPKPYVQYMIEQASSGDSEVSRSLEGMPKPKGSAIALLHSALKKSQVGFILVNSIAHVPNL
jgi:hypothetical protein